MIATIKKCSHDRAWYKDKIGEDFIVIDKGDELCCVDVEIDVAGYLLIEDIDLKGLLNHYMPHGTRFHDPDEYDFGPYSGYGNQGHTGAEDSRHYPYEGDVGYGFDENGGGVGTEHGHGMSQYDHYLMSQYPDHFQNQTNSKVMSRRTRDAIDKQRRKNKRNKHADIAYLDRNGTMRSRLHNSSRNQGRLGSTP